MFSHAHSRERSKDTTLSNSRATGVAIRGGLHGLQRLLPTRLLKLLFLDVLREHLVDRIKIEANKRDMPYQSLIKAWLKDDVDESRAE
tara:strand:+ start:185 stop:448 length:264 start_codon:yes stop_codon:yes gene_type:complete